MKVLKGYVRQAAKPKGCMAAGHMHFEAMFYASHAIEMFDSWAPTAWDEVDEEKSTSSLRLLGKKTARILQGAVREQVHTCVLDNDS